MTAAGDRPGEKRRHSRIELFATVELRGSDVILILSIKNISLGGAFLVADGADLGPFKIGSQQELVLFDGNDDDRRVTVTARIVRKDQGGMAVIWVGEAAVFQIAELLEPAGAAITAQRASAPAHQLAPSHAPCRGFDAKLAHLYRSSTLAAAPMNRPQTNDPREL